MASHRPKKDFVLHLHQLLVALALAGGSLSLALPANAATTIAVTLDNKPLTTDLPNNLGMAMQGADMTNAMMTVTAGPSVVPAGEVTFVATNKSTDTMHEMILIKVADAGKQLPYVATESRVNEDAAGHLGEVAELDPGKSGSLSMTLDPGTYMLFCNIPGHYMAGMWTTVTVR
jgi:uncharacterized cupredoxin-like copper-binding protein